ncbi:MAG: cell division protein FtsZ, partial [Desulfobulbaceae bacterium]
GRAVGENRALEAAKRAIDNQLLEDVGIDGARGLIINISASEDTFTLAEFMEASALIQEKVDEDAKIVVGALYDNALGDELQVTVIATGVGDVLKKKETIAQVDDLHKKKQNREPEVITSVVPAPANRHPRVAPLPGSNFDSFENLGVSNINEGDRGRKGQGWNEDYLETPTYLRKKAN